MTTRLASAGCFPPGTTLIRISYPPSHEWLVSVPSADVSGLVGTDVHASHAFSHTSFGTPSGLGHPQIFLPYNSG